MNWLKDIFKNESVVASAKTLGKALLTAALATFGVTWLSGCTSSTPSTHGQTTEIVAFGIPAIAWISHSSMCETNTAGDTNGTVQVSE